MKLGDKIIALRKKYGLSQEELAEKLNVSRQSVSKWESNNTYPETEKIIQLANLFNCSMDDLINEKITNLDDIERKEKNNINIDSLLEFITKSVDMFSKMSFWNGIKCLIELVIIVLLLALLGVITIGILGVLIESLFNFGNYGYIVKEVLSSILGIIWFILTIIVIIHIFKIRYLDYFDQTQIENKSSKNTQDNKNSSTKEKIIIRDQEHQPFAFLSFFSKLLIYFIKFWAIIFIFSALAFLFAFVVAFVILIPFCFNSLFFFGITTTILAGIIIDVLIAILLFLFFFNKKIKIKLYIIIFISSIILGGVGAGIGIIGLKDIEYKDIRDTKTLTYSENKIYYKDDLYIESDEYDTDYIIDNNIPKNEIIIGTKIDKELFKVKSELIDMYNMSGYHLYLDSTLNFKKFYNIFIKNLKNNVIADYSSSSLGVVSVKANEETISKLTNNFSKIYLYEKIEKNNGFRIVDTELKVEIIENDCGAEYDALPDNIKIVSPTCKCERKSTETFKGTKIFYDCEDEDDHYE